MAKERSWQDGKTTGRKRKPKKLKQQQLEPIGERGSTREPVELEPGQLTLQEASRKRQKQIDLEQQPVKGNPTPLDPDRYNKTPPSKVKTKPGRKAQSFTLDGNEYRTLRLQFNVDTDRYEFQDTRDLTPPELRQLLKDGITYNDYHLVVEDPDGKPDYRLVKQFDDRKAKIFVVLVKPLGAGEKPA